MPSRKASIVMATSKYRKTGGHESVINNLSVQLKRMGHEVSLASYSFDSDPPYGIKKVNLSRIEYLTNRSQVNDSDIIHSHQTQMNYLALISRRPLLFHYHGASSISQYYNLRLCYALLKKRIFSTVSVSRTAVDSLVQMVGQIPHKVLYNGVDTKIFKPGLNPVFKKGEPQLLFIGNLFRYKKVFWLIRLMPLLLKTYPEAHLVIIGAGQDYQRLRNYVEKEGLNKNITLLGQITHENLAPHYESCDIYISASNLESFNLPALEAMAMAKPVALSSIPAHREIIEASGGGRLFSTDSYEYAIQCVESLYQQRNWYASAGLTFAQKHDWSVVAASISKMYELALSLY